MGLPFWSSQPDRSRPGRACQASSSGSRCECKQVIAGLSRPPAGRTGPGVAVGSMATAPRATAATTLRATAAPATAEVFPALDSAGTIRYT
jgi:hypothetical protein